jgi:hypothetical protein
MFSSKEGMRIRYIEEIKSKMVNIDGTMIEKKNFRMTLFDMASFLYLKVTIPHFPIKRALQAIQSFLLSLSAEPGC